MLLLKWCTQYASKFGKLSSGHRTGTVSFHSNPKEGQCQRTFKLSYNCIISRTCRVMLKILQPRLQLAKVTRHTNLISKRQKKSEIKLLTVVGSWRNQRNSRRTFTSASLTMLKPLIVWITTNCGKF